MPQNNQIEDNSLAESHEIARAYIDVKYRGADAESLATRCRDWLADCEAREWRVREEFAGNRMLPSQLDLLDRARERVCAVHSNLVPA
ncbi:MAG: hypothetical protein VX529_06690 [Pseudomonadota bacterium]|nr:hypothetical protein [Pseudomonadota bacterium]